MKILFKGNVTLKKHVVALLRALLVCGRCHRLNAHYMLVLKEIILLKYKHSHFSIYINNMVKRCIAAGCSNTHTDGVE